MLHRDIKRANGLVTYSLDVKLSYFGLARLEPAFMSPKQLRDAPAPARAAV